MADSIQISSAKLASEMEDRSQTLVQLGETEPHGTAGQLYLHTFDIFVIWGGGKNVGMNTGRDRSDLRVDCM